METDSKWAKRLFVSGDRSSVGKSTICLSVLGSLVETGLYQPADLAYIKPASQCQDVQLVTKYCDAHGIAHRGIGPVVFYTGFTREVIRGECELTSEQMLDRVEEAVAALSKGKKLVIIDGVGYPSVGSVVGVSNAHIARKLQAKVLLVGKHGVGDAIDSFNLNATYFESFGVKVAAAIFNKVDEPYEDTKSHVARYFKQSRPDVVVLGFIPLSSSLAAKAEEVPSSSSSSSSSHAKRSCQLATKETLQMDEQEKELCSAFIEKFREYIDMDALTMVLNSL